MFYTPGRKCIQVVFVFTILCVIVFFHSIHDTILALPIAFPKLSFHRQSQDLSAGNSTLGVNATHSYPNKQRHQCPYTLANHLILSSPSSSPSPPLQPPQPNGVAKASTPQQSSPACKSPSPSSHHGPKLRSQPSRTQTWRLDNRHQRKGMHWHG